MTKKIHNYFFGQIPEMPWKKENNMNKREQKSKLVKELRNNMLIPEIYQDKPWTFVLISIRWNKQLLQSFGFSKVCHPDEWDADYGIELAVTKALYKLAKELL